VRQEESPLLPTKGLAVPDTGIERIVFVVGVVAIVGLFAALIPTYLSQERADSPLAPKPAPAKVAFAAGKTAVAAAIPPAASPVQLRIAATRADCWIQVRERSATGKVLYEGTLTQGTSLGLVAKRFWIRFGAAQRVDVALDGKPVPVPDGTVDVHVTADGVALAA
jgi:hypothetical protein